MMPQLPLQLPFQLALDPMNCLKSRENILFLSSSFVFFSTHTTKQVDARIVDVYRGAHGVVLMFNPQFRATWDYIKKEVFFFVSLFFQSPFV